MLHRSAPGRVPALALLAMVAMLPALVAATPAAPAAVAGAHAWDGDGTPAQLDAWVQARLKAAEAAIARLVAVKGPRTLDNTLKPYDEAFGAIVDAICQSQVLYGVGATRELRDKAQALSEATQSALTALNLNQAVYQALSALPQPADAGVRHYLERTLLEYRLAGVDRDEATRAKIKALQDKITERSLVFNRNVHDDVRKVVADKAELDGLPPDFLASHKPDAKGQITITSDPPDTSAVLKFANSAQLRKQLFLAAHAVAYPANTEVLRGLLQAREDLAHLLGYATWADFAMADQMMGSPAKLAEFVAQVDKASREPGAREQAALLAFAKEREPALQQIFAQDLRYWQEQYRRAKFNFDSQSVRPYFPYAAVEKGVLATASKLFHVQIRPVSGLKTWHPSVTTYEVYDGATRLGTIYLDMHPREGKDKWFSTQPLTAGARGRELPDGALVCNFPGGTPGDPGLMQYGDVVVFLHEFGHLMHHLIGGQNRYAGEGPFNIEGDFIEAPSQMLEEFFHDYGVLAPFAHHYQSGAVLPKELFTRMTRADTYGRASDEQRQLIFTAVSLDTHVQKAAGLDFDALWRKDFERYSTAAYLPGDHFWASMTHLTGYSSNYYTYVLDKVIALDFFAQFDAKNLLGGPAGMRYRHSVLAPGGSKAAEQLVRDFLGRDTNLDAYRRWMLAEFDAPATASSSAR